MVPCPTLVPNDGRLFLPPRMTSGVVNVCYCTLSTRPQEAKAGPSSLSELEEKSRGPFSATARATAAASPPLRGVFYSEFDNILGPKIVLHAGECPVGEVFDRVSDYVITKPQLVGVERGCGPFCRRRWEVCQQQHLAD